MGKYKVRLNIKKKKLKRKEMGGEGFICFPPSLNRELFKDWNDVILMVVLPTFGTVVSI